MHSSYNVTLRCNLKINFKIKSLVAWSIYEGRLDQKQIFNFVGPKVTKVLSSLCRDSRMINCHFVWPAVHIPERGARNQVSSGGA